MAKIFPHIPAFDRYTSLGSYPLWYAVNLGKSGECALCPDCATAFVRGQHESNDHRSFTIQADVNWEDPDFYCEDCGERIESAYAEPELCHESGYCDCACRDCFEIAIGTKGEPRPMCSECVEAGCEPDSECQRPEAYGGDPDGPYQCGQCGDRYDSEPHTCK